jgi:flagellar hook assembly protein FlgD
MNLLVCNGNETRNELWYNLITLGGAPKLKSEETITVEEENFEGVQVFPNPFNPSTSFRFRVRENTAVKLQIFNLNGQLVRTLVDGNLAPKVYKERWNGRNEKGHPVASGIYFYRLQIGRQIWNGKIQMIK